MHLRRLGEQRQESRAHKVVGSDVRAVRLDPILERSILRLEQILLHFLGGLGFRLE